MWHPSEASGIMRATCDAVALHEKIGRRIHAAKISGGFCGFPELSVRCRDHVVRGEPEFLLEFLEGG